jgi:hypothetical protein
MDARRTVPGPVHIRDKVYPLLFRDQQQWKGLKAGQFFRMPSMPATDQLLRRLGFCFMSRILRYAKLANQLLEYKEEKVDNLPPEGIATITGLTRAQVEGSFAEYELARQQHNSGTFPGILWFVANTYGQEAKVEFTSFRDVWAGFDERTEMEVFMKLCALDAGVDVGEFWQVEFHGATKASSWISHTKARGKGPAEFVVDFERWTNRIMPSAYTFRFDTPDDEEDLTIEKIRAARIKNLKDLWTPVGEERLITQEQALELAAEWQIIPSRLVNPPVDIATDIRKSLGRDAGIIRFPDRHIERVRPVWSLDRTMIPDLPLPVIKQETPELPDEVIEQLPSLMRRWDALDTEFTDMLSEWRRDVLTTLENDPNKLDKVKYWTDWGQRLNDQLIDEFIASAMAGVNSTGIAIGFDKKNEIARQIAAQSMFDMVKLDGPKSIVATRRKKLQEIKDGLADGTIQWSEVEGKLQPYFDKARARLLAVTENTGIFASAQLATGKEAGLTKKRSVRADAGRPCPTKVCPENEAAGIIGIDENFPSGHKAPSYHPHCYCYIVLS